MAKKKICIAISQDLAQRVIQFQKEHAIAYFSSTIETLITLGLDGADLIGGLDEIRKNEIEIAKYTLAILASISQHVNIPSETKHAGKASAEQMLIKALQAAKNPEQGGE